MDNHTGHDVEKKRQMIQMLPNHDIQSSREIRLRLAAKQDDGKRLNIL